MKYLLRTAVSAVVLFSILGCGKSSSTDAVPSLSAEQAKSALIELLRSTKLDYIANFPVEDRASDPITIDAEGSARWAIFTFDLKKRTYRYFVHLDAPKGASKGAFFAEFEGRFEFEKGKWIAKYPRNTVIT